MNNDIHSEQGRYSVTMKLHVAPDRKTIHETDETAILFEKFCVSIDHIIGNQYLSKIDLPTCFVVLQI